MGNIISSRNIIAGRKARRLTVLLGSAAVCGLCPTSAFAQCAPTSPSDYVCEGANAAGQVVTGPVSNVTTAPGFSVNAAGADALSITSTNGAASYIDENASSLTATGLVNAIDIKATNGAINVQTGGALTAGVEAVVVNQLGAGTVTLDLSGAIHSLGGRGVLVRDTVLGGDIRVTTGAVTAHTGAIDARTQSPTANVTVIANGDLQAGTSGIIAAVEAGGTGKIDLAANGAIDGLDGVTALNSGTGSVKITTVGPVNAVSDGIFALTNGGDVTVNAGDVTAGSAPAISVTQLLNVANASVIDVSAGDVSGSSGIVVRNIGTTSAAHIAANGTVTGTAGSAILATVGGAVNVSVADIVTGTTRGLTLVGGDRGTGDISVTGAGGFVGGTGDAANILNNGNGSVSVNISGASSSAEGNGIFVRDTTLGGDISVTTGAVTALGVDMKAIDVSALSLTGDVTVVANGDLQAGDTGIFAVIGFNAIGNIDVTANGAINAITGVRAVNVGRGSVKVTTVGPVNATLTGIDVQTSIGGGDVTVIAGDVTSTGGRGIAAQQIVFGADGADVSVTAGNVSGTSGILAFNAGNGATNIVANGTVTGTAGEGIEVTGSGAVSVSVADIVTGTTNGLTLVGGARGTGDISVTGAGGFVGGTGDAANILNSGDGNVIVNISGASSSVAGVGISVRDTALGGDVSVTTGAVTALAAGKNAIDVLAFSLTGDATVVANGDLQAGNAGVNAAILSAAGTGNVDVTAHGAVDARFGLDAENFGSGSTKVTAIGPVNATSGNGIFALTTGGDVTVVAGDVTSTGNHAVVVQQANAAGAGDVDVTTGNVSGTSGIRAINNGTGAIRVAAVGTVNATSDSGITAQAFGGDVTVKAADVISTSIAAIFAAQSSAAGAGDVDVIAANVSGKGGILANNVGTGSTSVTTTGSVNATSGRGIFAASSGGAVTVDAGDVTSTGSTAIIAVQVNATGAGVIDVTAGNVSGTSGINAENFGTGAVHVTANGAVTGTTREGIFATGNGAVSVVVGDTVTGATNGLTLVGGTGGTGDISVTGAGGFAGGTGDAANILNNGNGSVSVNISGASNSAEGSGIFVRDTGLGGDIGVTIGAVTALGAGKNAVDVLSLSATSDVTVVANGDLKAASSAIDVRLTNSASAGSIDITAGNASGSGGITAQNIGSGVINITSSGDVTGTSRAGISALTFGGDITVKASNISSTGDNAITATQFAAAGTGNIDVTAVNVSGQLNGVEADNFGTGSTRVTTTGLVNAATGAGISAGSSGGNITVQAADVTSAANAAITATQFSATGTGDIGVTVVNASGVTGVFAENSGSGAIHVTATGAVTGTGGNGVSATNTALGGDIGIATAAVTGTTAGINVDNRGIGNTTVTSTGDVIATAGAGLRVSASASTGDMMVNAVNTSGTVAGIDVRAFGTGDTVVNSVGTATGGTFAGVNVATGVTSGDITVNAHHASGTVGVQVLGDGIGATVVNVTGNTTGTINDGIFARNFQAGGTDLTVINAGTATGARFGIFAGNLGTGVTSITSTGDAIGGSDVDDAGIFAISGEGANGIVINATNATGFRGIDAENRGIGTIAVVATGNVTGIAEGLFAEAQATAGDISIGAHNVTGGTAGIGIDNAGTGAAVVNVSGVVQGGTAAISAISSDAQALTVNNNGTLRNMSGLSSDSAIVVNGGPLLLNNNGTLLGTLTLFGAIEDEDDDDQPTVATRAAARAFGFAALAVGEDDVVNNLVTWNSIGGTSDFGVGDDQLNNRATGRIIAAVAAGIAETTTYANLENFSNAGVIALNDGGTGDQLITDGSVIMESGSTLAIDIGAGNTTDILTVGGSATIQAGAKVAFTQLAPGALGDVHTFMTAADGVTGTFTLTNSLVTLFKGYRLGYTANSAFIEFAQLRALAAAGITPNQIAAATGADSLAFSNPIKAAALNSTSDVQAQAAFDALSGEIHPTVRTVMAEDSRLPRNAVLERLGANRTATVWGQAFGNWGDSDGNRNAAAADRDSYGFLAGADFGGSEEGGLIAGGVLGYIDTDVAVRDRASKASVKTLHGLLYAGVRAGGFLFKAGAGYARADIDTKRSVVFTGFADGLTDGYKGALLQGFAEAGYRLPFGEGYAEPYVGLTAIRVHSNAVAESGGAAAIKAASTNEKSLMTTAGIRFATGVSGALAVTGNVGWQHAFGGLDPVNIHMLAGSVPFRIEGTAQSRDAGIVGIALRYSISPAAEFELGYDGVLGTAAQDHAAKASFRIRF